MKRSVKLLSVMALLGAIALSSLSADDVSTPNAKDLQAVKKIMEDESISTTKPASKVVVSGYVETSYTKQFANSTRNGSGAVCTPNGSCTTGKLTVEVPLSDNNGLYAGFQVDAIHCSGSK